ncbi:hypothetical protein FIBSPDRAFT_803859 [Athelia psychrophila]|uniref:Uncharacterized protein n=1 Tax=Athelia psychrophila TaxID=1759441 RepID=A0A165WG48_9AGAM|nr:hypothetical protein FIBSPDRAFT_803859 [Fibularhizoctonia sp. CBS 109695]
MTCIMFRRNRGAQPAAFGHIQTLVDVIDVWAPKIYWGYKASNKSTGHAGTSEWPLPPMASKPDMSQIV